MKEILAEGLQTFFDNTGLPGKCTYKGKLYEVWEVSDEVFIKMDKMSEEDFENVCPDGMWRYSNGSIFGAPDVEYKINGKILKAWDDKRERYIRETSIRNPYAYTGLTDGAFKLDIQIDKNRLRF